MEETLSRIIAELDELRHCDTPNNPQPPPLSQQSLSDLQFLVDDSESLDQLYDELSAKNLSPSLLIQPIASAMDSGPPNVSLAASKVYLSLLLCPNAPVFTLFTPMSFLSFLRSIRRSFKHRSVGQSSHDEQRMNSENATVRKRKLGGRGKASKKNVRVSQNDDNEGEDCQFDVRALLPVLEKLVPVMSLIHLDRFPDSLKSLVQTMAEVLVLALEFCVNVGQYNRLADMCSRVLKEVLRPEHGEPSNTAAEVLKSLSSLILMTKSQARTFALDFVTTQMMRITKDYEGVEKAMINFPRFLAQRAPEKSEPRALAVESIMEIVRVMRFEDQIGFVKYVVQMAQGKSNLRLLAVDLILNLTTSLKDPLGMNSENEPWGRWCLEALMKRCSDTNAAIRARALSNLAQLVGSLSRDAKSQDALKNLLESCTVGDVNAGASINNLLRRRCMDDKTAVRKAALLLVTKLTALLRGALDETVLKTMGMACSDPLISMRKTAIAALSEVVLLLILPSNSFSNLFAELCLSQNADAKFNSLE